MIDLLPVIISGFVSGAAYGLLALGKVIIFKSTDTVNFAIADIATLAAFLALTMMSLLHLEIGAGLPFAIVVSGAIGVLVERLLIRPLGRDRNFLFIALVMTIGLGLFLRAFIGQVWGHQPVAFPPLVSGTVTIGGLAISWNKVLSTGVALVAMGAVAWFFGKTPFGIAMKAAAEDPFAARLIGLNAGRIASIAWFLGCGLSALAIVFLAAESSLSPTFALVPLFRALAGVFLGGFTSMPGAVVGGFVIGILDNLAARYVSVNFRDTIVFGVIVVVLFLRPAGFLGTLKKERV